MLRSVYARAGVVDSGKYLTTVNELCDQLPALRPQLLGYVVRQLADALDLTRCTKLLTEEEKGAVIAAGLSLQTGLPLAMARSYPYQLPSIRVPYTSEYSGGWLYVNGIEAGDVVCIVDDTLSTGGTIASLIDAIRLANANVDTVAVVAEKPANRGRAMLEETRSVTVVSLLRINVTTDGVTVLSGVD